MADLLTAIAALLWPLLVLTVLLLFRAQLKALLGGSEVTLELGGQKVTVKQLSDQQAALIDDLQRQVVGLRADLAGLRPPSYPEPPYPEWPPPWLDEDRGLEKRGDTVPGAPVPGGPVPGGPPLPPWQGGPGSPGRGPAAPEEPYADADDDDSEPVDRRTAPGAPWTQPEPPTRRPRSVLWVDDTPQDNALMLDSLRRQGVTVDLASTTESAMGLMQDRSYGAVISGMSRSELGHDLPDAGLRLLARVREVDRAMPVVLVGSGGPAERVQALAAGATDLTGSPVRILEILREYGVVDA
ncbi:hypothetical protein L1785_05340 [Antribacter sp. KLBMP9083]|uniref:Response regulatory domain-containing protein n=1 Tax=Antribacter soli TaxID=2910976 RepID=A0AA41QC37_9MICO|nr:hypothetical protein [Antribacter soli]MCF4120397.1 hypothetical protein [Antribacter soli]